MRPSIQVICVVLAVVSISQEVPVTNVQEDSTSQKEEHSIIACALSQTYANLSDFDFSPRNVAFEDTACLSQQMFRELGFMEELKIPADKLDRFILEVQKGYQQIPYHNWHHGFAALHFTFVVLKNCKFIGKRCFRPLDGLALMTAAMSHDLDHPGTSSQYQEEINSTMAQKYRGEGSILEHHHIEKTFNILGKNETDFVAHLLPEDRLKFMNHIKQIILATDLNRHFKSLPEEQKMANEGYDANNEKHQELLRSVIISAADLSDTTKDWSTVRKSQKSLQIEFFDQGDKERAMGLTPLKMMDKTISKNVAEGSEKFISEVVLPLYRVLVALCSEARKCLDSLERNNEYWKRSIPYFHEQSERNRSQLEILDDPQLADIPHSFVKEQVNESTGPTLLS